MIPSCVKDGSGTPVTVLGSTIHLSHFLFTDDLLLFTKVSEEQVLRMKDVMEKFCRASSMRVNE